MPPTPIVATLATANSLPDLRIFLKTLQLWNGPVPPTVYLFADATVAKAELPYKGLIHQKDTLTKYSAYTRAQMERMPGTYGSLWSQFMAEKIALLEWVFDAAGPEVAESGVFFLDADICFFGPLPTVPADATVALSPHYIRAADEARYGAFNGGFLWLKERAALKGWREACADSRFYEQAALEVLAPDAYRFPIQTNYGWWRLWQATEPAEDRMRAWSIRREGAATSGICVDGSPLLSIHTHLAPETRPATDVDAFNSFVLSFLKKLAAANHSPAKAMLRVLGPWASAK